MTTATKTITETRNKLSTFIAEFIKGIYYFRMQKPKDGVYEIERGDLQSEVTIGRWRWKEGSYEEGYTYYVPMWSVKTDEEDNIKVVLEEDNREIGVTELSTDELSSIADQLELAFDDANKQYKQRLMKIS